MSAIDTLTPDRNPPAEWEKPFDRAARTIKIVFWVAFVIMYGGFFVPQLLQEKEVHWRMVIVLILMMGLTFVAIGLDSWVCQSSVAAATSPQRLKARLVYEPDVNVIVQELCAGVMASFFMIAAASFVGCWVVFLERGNPIPSGVFGVFLMSAFRTASQRLKEARKALGDLLKERGQAVTPSSLAAESPSP